KIKGYEKVIFKYSKSRNCILRIEAMTALNRLEEENCLNLLLSQKQYLSRLDINIIVNEAEINMKDDCDFQALIESPSPRVAAIGLLILKIKNKIEYKELIIPILENKDEFLCEIAWEVFTQIASTEEDFEIMTGNFKKLNNINKLSVIMALKRFEHNDNLFDFLDKIIINEPVLIKIEAFKILFESSIDRFLPYDKSNDKNITIAYNEVVDFNIS
ncbi:hypothetical protein ACFLTI_04375, partial [Bacteroidota bacterium]